MFIIFINWLISALVIIAASYLLPGVHVQSFLTALVVAIVLGILNAVIKPILFLLTLPLTIITLGLFTFILNAFMILLASKIVPGFHVDNFWWALLFGIILSIFNSFLQNSKKEQKLK